MILRGKLALEKIIINGGRRLVGEVEISGAKNAVVAIIPATILAEGVCRIENIPNISDVSAMIKILRHLGAEIKMINKSTLEIDTSHIRSNVVEHDLSKLMRASYYFIGVLLGRFNHARVAMPGGCQFGVRPIDQHIKGFEALGAKVDVKGGRIEANADELIGKLVAKFGFSKFRFWRVCYFSITFIQYFEIEMMTNLSMSLVSIIYNFQLLRLL